MCAKLADFGTSKLLAPTLSGRDIFNPYWMAPEVINLRKGDEYNEKIDIYSFGMVMWEIWGENEPFSEYDGQYMGQPGVVLEKDICMGLRPTVPEKCPCGELMREVREWLGVFFFFFFVCFFSFFSLNSFFFFCLLI